MSGWMPKSAVPTWKPKSATPADSVKMSDMLDLQDRAATPQGTMPQTIRGVGRAALGLIPPAAGVAGGIIGGAADIPGGVIPGAVLGAGIAGAGGEAIRQNLSRLFGLDAPGTPLEALGGIGLQGAQQAGNELGGRVLTGIAGAIAKPLYAGALRAGKPLTREAVETASRLKGAPVAPDVADLAVQGLNERVGLGRGLLGKTGADRMATLTQRPSKSLGDALEAASTAGHTANINAVMDPIEALKAEVLSSETDGLAKAQQITQWQKDMRRQFSLPATDRGVGPMQRLTPHDLQRMKQAWQAQSENFYAAADRGAPDELQALRARFNAAAAQGARQHLESIPIASGQAGKTLGQVIAESNARLSGLHPLGTAVNNAEVGMVSGSSTQMPWYTHVGPAVAGGAAGTAMMGNAAGGAAGTLLGIGLDRLMANPAIASRTALGLTSTPARILFDNSPRALAYLLGLPEQPENTTTGGR